MGGGCGGELFGVVAWEGVCGDVEGMVPRTETKSDKFFVKSLYNALKLGDSSSFPTRSIWNSQVQPKISFFAWEVTWGKALTLDLVQKREWALANRYFMCHENEETIDHLIIHRVKTRVLSKMFFSLVKMSWVLPSSTRETLLSWQGFWTKSSRRFGEQLLYIYSRRYGRRGIE